MRGVWETVLPFRSDIQLVLSDDSSDDSVKQSVLERIDAATEVNFRAMHKAVGWYAEGVNSCPEFKPSVLDWERAVKEVGYAHILQQKIVKQTYLEARGLGDESVRNAALNAFKETIINIKFGSEKVPAIPACTTCSTGTNTVADKVFEASSAADELSKS